MFSATSLIMAMVWRRVPLAHIGKRSCRYNHQIRILRIAVISRSYNGSFLQIYGGVKNVKRLCFCLLYIYINIYDFFRKSLGNQCVACVGAHMSRSYDNDFSVL